MISLIIPISIFVSGFVLSIYALTRPYSALSYKGDGKIIGFIGIMMIVSSVILLLTTGVENHG